MLKAFINFWSKNKIDILFWLGIFLISFPILYIFINAAGILASLPVIGFMFLTFALILND